MSHHNEPKTRQEKKGNKYKEPYNKKSLRIQEELRQSKSKEKMNERTNEKTNEKTNKK
jgi:hypothetical protein